MPEPTDQPDAASEPAARPASARGATRTKNGPSLEIPEVLREDRPLPIPRGLERARRRAERKNSPEWRAAGIGLDFAAMVAGGAAMGYVADLVFKSFPTGTAIGGILGLLSGGWTSARLALRLNKDLERIEREQRAKKPAP